MIKTCSFVIFFLFVICGLQAQTASRAIIAHRGGAGEGLENTLSCIEGAVVMGVDAVEVDVYLTADGHVVVCHDATVDATTNGKGRVSELSLSEIGELRIVDADGCVTSEVIPTLKQVLQLVQGRCGLLIEVKKSGGGIEKKVIDDVVACGALSWVSVQSFSDVVLQKFYELRAPFPLEKLVVFKVPLLPLIYDNGLRFFSFKRYAYVSSFNFHKYGLPASFAAKIRSHDMGLKVWTVNSHSEIPDVVVDAVITDYPSLWMKK